MYCRNCGKKLDTEAEFCNECLAKFDDFGDDGEEVVESKNEVEQTITDSTYSYSSQVAYQPEKRTQAQPEGSIMAGFGPALTGTILSIFGIVFIMVTFILSTSLGVCEIVTDAFIQNAPANSDVLYLTIDEFNVLKGTTWIMFLISLGLLIPSLILGIKSIKTFVKAKREGLRKKPIPALAMGIETTAVTGFGILYAFLTLIMLLLI
ncbi:MAG: zinc ribbon domain-containing protein [Clostridia bacterium]|nr:zinc ribbon domain-containing protein [Clostridia bacterium]